ncbi:hypothetical protein BDA99DRAFT_541149 [Phascolomyces articulosus]|uniref:Uncharacterized protein n=1 Tax=Phascolomyces articulosus TaxID=60185 RepID=A0AAD5K2Q4_9FUNG|nr:hypothetical protein BDA99DRAFT_541149 [Phascolomyces articulosus]
MDNLNGVVYYDIHHVLPANTGEKNFDLWKHFDEYNSTFYEPLIFLCLPFLCSVIPNSLDFQTFLIKFTMLYSTSTLEKAVVSMKIKCISINDPLYMTGECVYIRMTIK